MKRERKQIGQIIRDIRRAKRMSQMKLAEKVNISYQQIQKYEKGISSISIERLRQISKALDIPINLFFPSGKEMVSETPAIYGKMTDDEQLLLQLFRHIKDKKLRGSILEFLKDLSK
jgi:transcriptional regulator with XRE-family HTH domain